MSKRRLKDNIKQRAGRIGARARWRNDLKWHRQLEKLRGGFSGSWKLLLWHAVFRYVFLYRADGRKLSEAAREELLEMTLRFRPLVRLSVEKLAALARCPQSDWERSSVLNTHWTRATIRRWLNVSDDEQKKLTPKVQPQPSRREKRLAAMIVLRDRLMASKRQFPSVRWMQRALVEHGVQASFETVRKDLQKLPAGAD